MKSYPIISENEFHIKEIQISYKKRKLKPVKITNSGSAANALRKIWDKKLLGILEQFVALYLDRGNNILGYKVISTGGVSGTVVDVRLILSVALKTLTSSIILAHNHPSGTLTYSDADLRITQKIMNASHEMDISILDHIILTEDSYYSFADAGKI